MKSPILLFALAALAFTSCTAYKTGQTPDDVYFSPERPADEYVVVDKNDNRYYDGDDQYYEDRYLRMRVRDRYRWGYLDDYYFYNRPSYFAYGYYGYSSWNFGSPWNSYWYWNNFYNPYCRNTIVYYNPKGSSYRQPVSRPVVFNPDTYKTANSNNRSMLSSYSSRYGSGSYNNTNSRYNNSNSSGNRSLGNSLRKVFSGSSSSSGNNSTYTPSRTYNPSNSSGSSSSGSRSSGSSSGGGVSRPTRGGGR